MYKELEPSKHAETNSLDRRGLSVLDNRSGRARLCSGTALASKVTQHHLQKAYPESLPLQQVGKLPEKGRLRVLSQTLDKRLLRKLQMRIM